MKRFPTIRSRRPDTTLWRVAALCGLLAVTTALEARESSRPESRPESPLWWTLTEELSSAELQAAWEDLAHCRARRMQALQNGLWDAPSRETGVEIRCLAVGALTPELIPLWQAFHSFAMPLASDSGPRLQPRAVEALRGYGFTGPVAERIVGFARRFETEAGALFAEIREPRAAFVELLRQARARLPAEVYREAVRGRDVDRLARTTETDFQDAERWMLAWERNPLAERARSILPLLQAELTPSEWSGFREFLLTRVATRTTVVDFHDG